MDDHELERQLAALRSQMGGRSSPEITRAVDDQIALLASAGLAQRALQVGETAPGFTLPNVRGAPVALQDLLRRGPVVLAFYRGGW